MIGLTFLRGVVLLVKLVVIKKATFVRGGIKTRQLRVMGIGSLLWLPVELIVIRQHQ